MAFTVYPTSATPTSLIAGGSTAFVLLAGHVGPDPTTSNLPTTFIRIAMSGAAAALPPTVELIAGNPTAMTQGLPVTIVPGINNDLLDGFNATPQASAAFVGPNANNVYFLKVVIFLEGLTLQLRITNNTAATRDFTWVVADSDANAKQPWAAVSPTSLGYTALINQSPTLVRKTLVVANKGTKALTINDVPGAIGVSQFSIVSISVNPVPPNGAANVLISFAASATIGTTATSYTVASDDSIAAHTTAVALAATTEALEIALLLDDSGSMSWLPNGDPAPIATASRWGELSDAASQFLTNLSHFTEHTGRFGIAKFPAQGPVTDPKSYDIFAMDDITVAHLSAAQTEIGKVVPSGGTPMGDGLDRVLNSPPFYFSSDPTAISINRRWLMLMSDGASNSGTHDPHSFNASLSAKNITPFTVAYGLKGKADVDHDLLAFIASSSPNGQVAKVDQDGITATDLAASLRNVIKTGLTSLASSADPYGELTAYKANATHPILITPYDTKVVFALNWNTPDAERMRLELISPTCDLITPENAGDNTDDDSSPPESDERVLGVRFDGGNRYQMYRIDEEYLRNDFDPEQPRYGNWRMVVSSSQISDSEGDSERYTYDVLIESRLRMDIRLDRGIYYAGDPIGISAVLTVDGAPITNAAVQLSLTAPGQSVNNWLAGVAITEAEFRAAAQALEGRDVGALAIKAYAARQKGILFDGFTNAGLVAMTDPDDQGSYTATISDTSTPEDYTFYIIATGLTSDGFLFRREKAVQVRVGVRPEPAFTIFDIDYAPLSAGQPAVATVRVTPRDRFGNVYLRDLASNPSLDLSVKNGNFNGPLVSLLNGSYTRQLVYTPGNTPVVTLQVDGFDVIPGQVVAPALDLSYADQVVAFTQGGEAQPGANQHTDPNAALGSVLQTPADSFVSLGAFGALAVRVKGRLIRAQGADDVTVFVHADDSLRPYRVEAYVTGRKEHWVALGESPGTTQSFGLSAAGLKTTRAVRVIDLSGRIRDTAFAPSATPGVSVRSVGFAELDDDEAIFPASALLDDFNRDDGPVGGSWSGGTDDFVIAKQQLRVREDGVIYWQPDSFGALQEAFVTLAAIDPQNSRASVLLKVQGDEPNVRNGAIEARYYAKINLLRLQVRLPGRDWQVIGEFPITFNPGDQLGARSIADNKVQTYRNGRLIGEVQVDRFFADRGGRIGLRLLDADPSVLDDFGGGSLDGE